jgi:acyl carrier protein
MKEKISKVIFNSIEELNSNQDETIIVNEGLQTVLYGKDSRLDSIGLVNLIVLVENNIEDEFGTSLSLTSEKALSQKRSPFHTIESLTEFIFLQLKEAENE